MINKLYNLFRKEEKKIPAQPIIHEAWSPDEVWSASSDFDKNQSQMLLQSVYNQFLLWKNNPEDSHQFHFIDGEKASGFSIYCKKNNINNFQALVFLSHILMKSRKLNYVVNVVDVMTRQKGENLEAIFRIYIKPSAKLRIKPKAEQIYGNLHLEFISKNDQAYQIKIQALKYSDQNFEEPMEFDGYLEFLAQS